MPAAYHTQLTGLEFPYAAARPGTVLDYHALIEPSILGKKINGLLFPGNLTRGTGSANLEFEMKSASSTL